MTSSSVGHGVLEAPRLQQGNLEALLAERRVVEGGAAAGVAVVQLRVNEQRVAVAAASWLDEKKFQANWFI